MPTRAGRHGLAYTRWGKINLRNARNGEDKRPLDLTSACPAARDYSRAYLHHLVRCQEILGMMLLTWVNLAYYQDLMAGAARRHREGSLRRFSPRGERKLGAGRGARLSATLAQPLRAINGTVTSQSEMLRLFRPPKRKSGKAHAFPPESRLKTKERKSSRFSALPRLVLPSPIMPKLVSPRDVFRRIIDFWRPPTTWT